MEKHFKFTNSVIGLPLSFVVLLWFVFWLQIRFDFDFVENGIYPRTFSGLQGIFFSPFIHADIEHLYNNSIPLLILLTALQFFYAEQAMKVIGYGILISGCITWSIGRENYHIGASGLIYVLFSFVFFKGLQTKYNRLVALSLAVIVVYGGLVWYVFPSPEITGNKSISWEGHLGGLLAGFFLSLVYKTPQYKKVIKYDWEHPDFDATADKFMQRFDENGNFVNLPQENEEAIFTYYTADIPINYSVVPDQKKESKPQS
ncbi:rhomboid family intramembrane serine protease [Flavobacterium sandaracinum]|uniref:Rhomboid family intramembrane serine protease n=1 Tax=Flavobacterium sandaracinum TaxID=2541733 RepID=A0A4V2Z1G6_9FLAO|nr:rhomboid family intramembrane serine protease [Flavobacterium sandaracinum]TDE04698.1 rhomboid family intramembrane serine protease [Flavobacterium sandaracinum]